MREVPTPGNPAGRLFPLLARDTAWAARRLGRTPGFVAVAVLTLAMAIAPSASLRCE